ncbi:MAG: Gfo/Idh/MocA family oxidoreductase [Planctomycetota bacterium]
MTSSVRLGVIGCGGIARHHRSYFAQIDGLVLAGAADALPEAAGDYLAQAPELTPVAPDAQAYSSGASLIESGQCDAVLIATPHHDHPRLAAAALEAGLHVLVEKPIAVSVAEADALLEARSRFPDPVFAAMFNQRTHPIWRTVKSLIDDGRLGELRRTAWTITDWFRTHAYYASGGWRATWKGEGGGVLLNQCPHNLDLFQWFAGMPRRVRAVVGLGRRHPIEVEDEVTAVLEYGNSATGTFITGTGEAPGENRVVLVGDRATVVATLGGPGAGGTAGGASSGGTVTLYACQTPVSAFLRTSPEPFGKPEVVTHDLTPSGEFEDHLAITRNFVNAIRHGEPLIAPAEEGVHGLELGNAMLLAGLEDRAVDLPLCRSAYAKRLDALVAGSAGG